MSSTLRGILIFGVIIYFLIVLRLLKTGRLMLKYTLLWMLMGIVMAMLIIFPGLLQVICNMCGVESGMNGLFTFLIGFILMLMMAMTVIVSKQSERIKNLVQENALLEKRIRDIENCMKS